MVAVTMALFGAKSFSRSPEVFSIREIMEEKMAAKAAALAAIADDVTEVVDISQPAQVTLPEPQRSGSNVRRIPI
jgi:hypothetical protein